MRTVIIDSCVLIDYLQGKEGAKEEVLRWRRPSISTINWIEVMVGAHDNKEKERYRRFLTRFDLVPLDDKVRNLTVKLRRRYNGRCGRKKIKLPDAIVWASALRFDGVLLTTDKDFPDAPCVRRPDYAP